MEVKYRGANTESAEISRGKSMSVKTKQDARSSCEGDSFLS